MAKGRAKKKRSDRAETPTSNDYVRTGFRIERVAPGTAMQLYEQAAGMGSLVGLYNLSCCYAFGFGCRRDVQAAIALEREAARRGQADAINALAYRYMNGLGVRRDERRSIALHRTAASLGSLSSSFSLGQYYLQKDEDKAFEFFEQGAQGGHRRCLYYCGRMLLEGRGCAASPARGKKMIKDAAARGSWQARRLMQSKLWRRLTAPTQQRSRSV